MKKKCLFSLFALTMLFSPLNIHAESRALQLHVINAEESEQEQQIDITNMRKDFRVRMVTLDMMCMMCIK